MFRETRDALIACVLTFALCAVAYPAVVYGVGHTLFPRQAQGSLIEVDGKVVGSDLIAQPFASDKYFSPRPSAAGSGYAADAASGSNLGTTNPALHDRIALDASRQILRRTGDADLKAKLDRLDAIQAALKAKNDLKEKTKADEDAIAKLTEDASAATTAANDRAAELGKKSEELVPVDLITASGAGLDPDITPETAAYQAPRVAAARGVTVDKVKALIDEHIDTSGGIIGAPARVNVLKLNIDLDKKFPAPEGGAKPAAANIPEPAPAGTAASADVKQPTSSESKMPATAAPAAIEALAARLDKLQEKVDAAASYGVAVEVRQLKAQVAKLSDPAADPNAKRLGELDERVAGIGRDLEVIRANLKEAREFPKADDAVAALDKKFQDLRSDFETLRQAANKKEEAEPARVPDLGPALALFREKKYAAAADAFRTLATAHPEDARPWYFAAIANGLATRNWRGETEQLVNKGVERERAGTPSAIVIDATLADLTHETGKDWLAYFRARAAKP